MAGWDYYGNQEYGADFLIEPLGYAFGNMFEDVYLTYNPAGVPAAQFLFDGTKRTPNGRRGFYAETGIYSGNRNPYVQDPTGLEFKIKNSPVVAAELGYSFDATRRPDKLLPQGRKLHPGIFRFGGAYNPGSFTNQLTGVQSKGNYLIYLLASQPCIVSNADRIAVLMSHSATTLHRTMYPTELHDDGRRRVSRAHSVTPCR